METILKIKEIDNWKENKDDCQGFDGWKIKTNKQNIKLLISNEQCCCEGFGIISTEDNLKDFIGAELFGISTTDTDLRTELIKNNEDLQYMDEGDFIFINFKTSKGDFQLAVYNSHNGYYGHTVLIKMNGKETEKTL